MFKYLIVLSVILCLSGCGTDHRHDDDALFGGISNVLKK